MGVAEGTILIAEDGLDWAYPVWDDGTDLITGDGEDEA